MNVEVDVFSAVVCWKHIHIHVEQCLYDKVIKFYDWLLHLVGCFIWKNFLDSVFPSLRVELKHGREICLAFRKQKSVLIIRTEADPTSQRIERVPTRKNKRLIFGEIITVCSSCHTEHT
jgi:hypothetical protein